MAVYITVMVHIEIPDHVDNHCDFTNSAKSCTSQCCIED